MMSNIKLFESKQIRSYWNEKELKWYFSVQDVVEILTDTVDVKDYIKKMKKRDAQLNVNWGTICTLVARPCSAFYTDTVSVLVQFAQELLVPNSYSIGINNSKVQKVPVRTAKPGGLWTILN